MADETQPNGSGSVATIRELHRAVIEQDDRHEKAMAQLRTELTTRLDMVLQNQQAAALSAAERNGRDDARLKALELAVMKVGDEGEVIAANRAGLAALRDEVEEIKADRIRDGWKQYGRSVAAACVAGGGVVGVLKLVGL